MPRKRSENERLYAYNDNDNTGFDYLKLFDKLQHVKRPRLFANDICFRARKPPR